MLARNLIRIIRTQWTHAESKGKVAKEDDGS